MRPRTKHIAVKMHHFRSFVKADANPNGTIEIVKIDTTKQKSDLLTKPVGPIVLERLRFSILGW
jgi:hypothetical protein